MNRPTPWPFGEIIDENCAIVHIDLWRHNDFVRTAIGVKNPTFEPSQEIYGIVVVRTYRISEYALVFHVDS